MKVTAIIPARLDSVRLANKVLEDICGKPMVIHIYETLKQCAQLSELFLATEDLEISEVAKQYNVPCILTGKCNSGTQRVIEAYASCEGADLLINVQGDEPLISCEHINALINVFHEQPDAQIATLIEPFKTHEELLDPNNVKVVLSDSGKAIYFSRSVIPHSEVLRDFHYKHVGIYAFRHGVIDEIKDLKRSQLSLQERLEQLDWLVADMPIYTAEVHGQLIGVDTKDDLLKVRSILSEENTIFLNSSHTLNLSSVIRPSSVGIVASSSSSRGQEKSVGK